METRGRVYEFKPGEPPTEIQLWNIGDNATDYGVHRWTERSVREVMARYTQRGNPLQIDIEHGCAEEPDPANPPPTGGYARLEIRDGAPWLIFDWSAYAIEQIATRQRLFLSPDYCIDKETGEITKLLRVSLVSNPGTHNARMLASAKRVRAGGRTMLNPEVIAALEAIAAADDPKQALQNYLAELKKAAEGSAPETTEQPAEASAGGSEDPQQTTAEGTEDPDKDKNTAPVAAKVRASAQTPESALELAQRVAELEEEARRAKIAERIAAAGDRIPDSLKAFAKTLDLDALDKLIAGLPAPQKTTGIRASAKPTQGGNVRVPTKSLPEQDQRYLASAFGETDWASGPVTTKPDGRVVCTHLHKKGAR